MKRIVFLICLCCTLQVLGQEKWQNKINSFKINYGVTLQKADSMGWLVVTNTKSFSLAESKNQLVLLRYDKCGNVRWAYSYETDTAAITATDALSDNEGNIILAGNYAPSATTPYDTKFFIMKISPGGNVIWAKVSNLSGVDYVYSIAQANNGAYFVFSNHDNMGDALTYNAITKISSDGNLLWYKYYADNPIWGSAIATSDDGLLIRSGNLIYKLNQNGVVLWANSYTNIRYTCEPTEIDNQYVFASYPLQADSICFLFSLSATGNLNWISPSFKSTTIKSIKRLSNGNLMVTGSIQSTSSSAYKICFTEFSSSGSVIQQQTIDASDQQLPTYGSDFIELDNQSLVYAAYERSAINSDYLILIKSRKLTDFSCSQTNTNITTLPQQQINVTPYSIYPINNPNQLISTAITKSAVNINMTMKCFVPDNNTINLGNDTLLCPNQSLVLNTGLGSSYQYLWSTGATSPSINIHQAGTYWVKAFVCDTICDTIVVSYVTPLFLNYTISPLVTNPYILVNFKNFTFPYSQLSWQTGDGYTYNSDNFQHQYQNGGIYYPLLTITDNYGCVYSAHSKVIVDEVTFYVPNSFSPNGDNCNDLFIPKCTGVDRYEMFIYNRWGEEIFTVVNQGWNGKLKGNQDAMQGTYNYKIIVKDIFGKESIRSGSITLFR
ncbi:MAG: gliding motility-associated C-terminal domain-containing protein [Bacteroidetes bacterium]|nr:gliding motility-associated C-terminal domain-containing protein [Bacteroidota bacterium]